MKILIVGIVFLLFSIHSYGKPPRHVVIISIDGLRPVFYREAIYPMPNLQTLIKRGGYADHMKSVFPSYTYPSHVAMLTGALPARSGIYYNAPIDSKGDWNWFTSAIKVPTLWQVLKNKGLTTAAVQWPVSVSDDITWNIPEVWDRRFPSDRITETRKYATKGLIEEIELHATGRLDSTNMHEGYLGLDANSGRMAAYIFSRYRPSLLAVHFAGVDGKQHEHGTEDASVKIALANVDNAIGVILETVESSGLKDSTTILIVGDHGFANIHTVMRPNMLIRNVKASFVASGGSCFLYRANGATRSDDDAIVKSVTDSLNKLPEDRRKLFRIIGRRELDKMGADCSALLALSAVPGLVFSGSLGPVQVVNQGPGTVIGQNRLAGVFSETSGGHHGYDPELPEMWTGFIAAGAGIKKGGRVKELCVTDIAPLVARLLGLDLKVPDGRLVPGILVPD